MKALPVDTLKYVKILTSTKVPREQAEAHVEALTMALTDSVATKEDVTQVRSDLTHKIELVEKDLIIKIDKSALWQVGIQISAMGILLAIATSIILKVLH